MPAFRVLVNTPTPQGSTGITTNVFPAMTLGCGAMAGNITSDNVGPQHLINIKRLAYVVRKAEDAFTMSVDEAPAASIGPVDRQTVTAAVERYLNNRGMGQTAEACGGKARSFARRQSSRMWPRKWWIDFWRAAVLRQIRARLCASRHLRREIGVEPHLPCLQRGAPSRIRRARGEKRAEQPIPIADFVCEDDVRTAMKQSRKIFIGPRPSLRRPRAIWPAAAIFWSWPSARRIPWT